MTKIISNHSTFILKFILLICTQQVSLVCSAQSVSLKQLKIGKSSENVFASDYFNGAIYFCSDKKNKSHKTVENEYKQNFLDLYSVQFDLGNLRLGSEVLLDSSVNSPLNEGPIDIYEDSKIGYFSSNKVDSTTTNLYLTLFETKLSERNDFDARKEVFKGISGYNIAHPTVAKDGRVLVFSSDSKESIGQTDLYMSKLIEGKWSQPKVIEGLNTVAIETFPHFYGNTLYFSSDRVGSAGGLDVYKCSYGNGQFSSVEQLNNPINSEFDDFLYIPITETQGLLSSNRDGVKDRIYHYKIDLPQPKIFNEVNNDFCYQFADDGNIDTNRFKHTWKTGDGTMLQGQSVSYCFKDTGTYIVSCDLLDSKSGKKDMSFISTEISIVINSPSIKADMNDGKLSLSIDNKYSEVDYTENYWIVNNNIYSESKLVVPIDSNEVEVKLVLWEKKKAGEAIGIVKLIATNP